MDITFGELSVTGPVRERNEDSIGVRLATDPEEKRTRGSAVVIADGVAGSGRGGDASKLAIEVALKVFAEAPPHEAPKDTLARMFADANLAVYDAGMKGREQGRGATTLTAVLFRGYEITVGHVGDCRAYLIQGSMIRRLTSDQSYAGLQVKMGFITPEEAMKSQSRYSLTGSLGPDPFVRVEYSNASVIPGNYVVLCSDGLHATLKEGEILSAVAHHSPAEACRFLCNLAEKRGSEDNISVQVARIDRIERVVYYHGVPYYPKEQPERLHVESEVGKVLDDRFELQAELSEGGMARVYRALDRSTNRPVAIKIPFMRYESDPGSFSRFEREERIGAMLEHPSILRVVPVEKKTRQYIVMEYLEGQTLAKLLSKVKPLPIEDAVRIASRLCEAMEYMHENGVVHLDLKPHNVMVCDDGSLRIMDFGIARLANERKVGLANFNPTMGTPDYMAPEQVRGKAGTEQTDIYSLGAMLYEMTTGSVPYSGADAFMVMNARLSGDPVAPRKLRPEISPVLEEIILHALEREPGQRYLSVTGLKSDLDHQDLVRLTGRAERLRAPSVWYAHWRRVRIGVFAVLFILSLFGLIYVIAHAPKNNTKNPASRTGPRK